MTSQSKARFYIWRRPLRDLTHEFYFLDDKLPKLIDDDDIPIHLVSDHYVHLQVVSTTDDDSSEDKEGGHRDSISPDDLVLNLLARYGRCLIVGDAGSGKTTLMHYIAYRWSNNPAWQQRYPYVFRLKLRDLTHDVERAVRWDRGLETYVEKYILEAFIAYGLRNMPGGYGLKSLVKIIIDRLKRIPKQNILFLVDGYDEVAHMDQDISDVKRIMDRLMEWPNIIMTSRPTALSDHLSQKHNSRKSAMKCILRNKGFDEAGKRLYIRNHFRSRPEKSFLLESSMWKFIEGLPMVKLVADIPMNLMLLCVLWGDETSRSTVRDSEGSLSILYSAMISWICKIYIRKVEERSDAVGSVDAGSLLSHPLVSFLKRLSFDMTVNGVLEIYADEVNKSLLKTSGDGKRFFDTITDRFFAVNTKSKISALEAVNKFGLLQAEGTHQPLKFMHKSFQEWLCAGYIIDNLSEFPAYLQAVMKRDVDQSSHIIVMKFAAGLLAQSNHEESVKLAFWDTLCYHTLGGSTALRLPDANLMKLFIAMFAEANRANPSTLVVHPELLTTVESYIAKNVLSLKDVLKSERYTSSQLLNALLDEIDRCQSEGFASQLLHIVSHLGIPKHHRVFLFNKLRDMARTNSFDELQEQAVRGLYAHVYLGEAYDRIVELARDAPRRSRLLAMQFVTDLNGLEAFAVLLDCAKTSQDEVIISYALNCLARLETFHVEHLAEVERLASVFSVGPIAVKIRALVIKFELQDAIINKHMGILQKLNGDHKTSRSHVIDFETSLRVLSTIGFDVRKVHESLAALIELKGQALTEERLSKTYLVLHHLPLFIPHMAQENVNRIFAALNIFLTRRNSVPDIDSAPTSVLVACLAILERMNWSDAVTLEIFSSSSLLTFIWSCLPQGKTAIEGALFSKDDLVTSIKRYFNPLQHFGDASFKPRSILDILLNLIPGEQKPNLFRIMSHYILSSVFDGGDLLLVAEETSRRLLQLLPESQHSVCVEWLLQLATEDNDSTSPTSVADSNRTQIGTTSAQKKAAILLLFWQDMVPDCDLQRFSSLVLKIALLELFGENTDVLSLYNAVVDAIPPASYLYVSKWLLGVAKDLLLHRDKCFQIFCSIILTLDCSISHARHESIPSIIRALVSCSSLEKSRHYTVQGISIVDCVLMLFANVVQDNDLSIVFQCFALRGVLPAELLSCDAWTRIMLEAFRDIILRVSTRIVDESVHCSDDLDVALKDIVLAEILHFGFHAMPRIISRLQSLIGEMSEPSKYAIGLHSLQALKDESEVKRSPRKWFGVLVLAFCPDLILFGDEASHFERLESFVVHFVEDDFIQKLKASPTYSSLSALCSAPLAKWVWECFVTQGLEYLHNLELKDVYSMQDASVCMDYIRAKGIEAVLCAYIPSTILESVPGLRSMYPAALHINLSDSIAVRGMRELSVRLLSRSVHLLVKDDLNRVLQEEFLFIVFRQLELLVSELMRSMEALTSEERSVVARECLQTLEEQTGTTAIEENTFLGVLTQAISCLILFLYPEHIPESALVPIRYRLLMLKAPGRRVISAVIATLQSLVGVKSELYRGLNDLRYTLTGDAGRRETMKGLYQILSPDDGWLPEEIQPLILKWLCVVVRQSGLRMLSRIPLQDAYSLSDVRALAEDFRVVMLEELGRVSIPVEILAQNEFLMSLFPSQLSEEGVMAILHRVVEDIREMVWRIIRQPSKLRALEKSKDTSSILRLLVTEDRVSLTLKLTDFVITNLEVMMSSRSSEDVGAIIQHCIQSIQHPKPHKDGSRWVVHETTLRNAISVLILLIYSDNIPSIDVCPLWNRLIELVADTRWYEVLNKWRLHIDELLPEEIQPLILKWLCVVVRQSGLRMLSRIPLQDAYSLSDVRALAEDLRVVMLEELGRVSIPVEILAQNEFLMSLFPSQLSEEGVMAILHRVVEVGRAIALYALFFSKSDVIFTGKLDDIDSLVSNISLSMGEENREKMIARCMKVLCNSERVPDDGFEQYKALLAITILLLHADCIPKGDIAEMMYCLCLYIPNVEVRDVLLFGIELVGSWIPTESQQDLYMWILMKVRNHLRKVFRANLPFVTYAKAVLEAMMTDFVSELLASAVPGNLLTVVPKLRSLFPERFPVECANSLLDASMKLARDWLARLFCRRHELMGQFVDRNLVFFEEALYICVHQLTDIVSLLETMSDIDEGERHHIVNECVDFLCSESPSFDGDEGHLERNYHKAKCVVSLLIVFLNPEIATQHEDHLRVLNMVTSLLPSPLLCELCIRASRLLKRVVFQLLPRIPKQAQYDTKDGLHWGKQLSLLVFDEFVSLSLVEWDQDCASGIVDYLLERCAHPSELKVPNILFLVFNHFISDERWVDCLLEFFALRTKDSELPVLAQSDDVEIARQKLKLVGTTLPQASRRAIFSWLMERSVPLFRDCLEYFWDSTSPELFHGRLLPLCLSWSPEIRSIFNAWKEHEGTPRAIFHLACVSVQWFVQLRLQDSVSEEQIGHVIDTLLELTKEEYLDRTSTYVGLVIFLAILCGIVSHDRLENCMYAISRSCNYLYREKLVGNINAFHDIIPEDLRYSLVTSQLAALRHFIDTCDIKYLDALMANVWLPESDITSEEASYASSAIELNTTEERNVETTVDISKERCATRKHMLASLVLDMLSALHLHIPLVRQAEVFSNVLSYASDLGKDAALVVKALTATSVYMVVRRDTFPEEGLMLVDLLRLLSGEAEDPTITRVIGAESLVSSVLLPLLRNFILSASTLYFDDITSEERRPVVIEVLMNLSMVKKGWLIGPLLAGVLLILVMESDNNQPEQFDSFLQGCARCFENSLGEEFVDLLFKAFRAIVPEDLRPSVIRSLVGEVRSWCHNDLILAIDDLIAASFDDSTWKFHLRLFARQKAFMLASQRITTRLLSSVPLHRREELLQNLVAATQSNDCDHPDINILFCSLFTLFSGSVTKESDEAIAFKLLSELMTDDKAALCMKYVERVRGVISTGASSEHSSAETLDTSYHSHVLQFLRSCFFIASEWILSIETFEPVADVPNLNDRIEALRAMLPLLENGERLLDIVVDWMDEWTFEGIAAKVFLWIVLIVLEDVFLSSPRREDLLKRIRVHFRWREESIDIPMSQWTNLRSFVFEEILAMKVCEALIACSFHNISLTFTEALWKSIRPRLSAPVLFNLIPEFFKLLRSFSENDLVEDTDDGRKARFALQEGFSLASDESLFSDNQRLICIESHVDRYLVSRVNATSAEVQWFVAVKQLANTMPETQWMQIFDATLEDKLTRKVIYPVVAVWLHVFPTLLQYPNRIAMLTELAKGPMTTQWTMLKASFESELCQYHAAHQHSVAILIVMLVLRIRDHPGVFETESHELISWLMQFQPRFQQEHWTSIITTVSSCLESSTASCLHLLEVIPDLAHQALLQSSMIDKMENRLWTNVHLAESVLPKLALYLEKTTAGEDANDSNCDWVLQALYGLPSDSAGKDLISASDITHSRVWVIDLTEKFVAHLRGDEWKVVLQAIETSLMLLSRDQNEIAFVWLRLLPRYFVTPLTLRTLISLATFKLEHHDDFPLNVGIQLLSLLREQAPNQVLRLFQASHINRLITFAVEKIKSVEYHTVESHLALSWLSELEQMLASQQLLVHHGEVEWDTIAETALALLNENTRYDVEKGYAVLRRFPSLASRVKDRLQRLVSEKLAEGSELSINVAIHMLVDLKKDIVWSPGSIPLTPLLLWKPPSSPMHTVDITKVDYVVIDEILERTFDHTASWTLDMSTFHEELHKVLEDNSHYQWTPVRFGLVLGSVWWFNRQEVTERFIPALVRIPSQLASRSPKSVNLKSYWDALIRCRPWPHTSLFTLAKFSFWTIFEHVELCRLVSSTRDRVLMSYLPDNFYWSCLWFIAQYRPVMVKAMVTNACSSRLSVGSASMSTWYREFLQSNLRALESFLPLLHNQYVHEETSHEAIADSRLKTEETSGSREIPAAEVVVSNLPVWNETSDDNSPMAFVDAKDVRCFVNGSERSSAISEGLRQGVLMMQLRLINARYRLPSSVTYRSIFPGVSDLVPGVWQIIMLTAVFDVTTVSEESANQNSASVINEHRPNVQCPKSFVFFTLVLFDHVWIHAFADRSISFPVATSKSTIDTLMVCPLGRYKQLSTSQRADFRRLLFGKRTQQNWGHMYLVESWELSSAEQRELQTQLVDACLSRTSLQERVNALVPLTHPNRVLGTHRMLCFGTLVGGDSEEEDAQETTATMANSLNALERMIIKRSVEKDTITAQQRLDSAMVECHALLQQLQGRVDGVDEALHALGNGLASFTALSNERSEDTLRLLGEQNNHLHEHLRRCETDRNLLHALVERVQTVEVSLGAITSATKEPQNWSEYQRGVYFYLIQTLHGIGLSAQVIGSQLVVMNQTGNLSKLGDLLSLVSSTVPVFGLATQITGSLLKAVDSFLQEQMLQHFSTLEKSPVDMDLLFKRVATTLLGDGSEETMLLDRELLDASTEGMSIGERLLSTLHQRVVDYSGQRELHFPSLPLLFDDQNRSRDHAGKIACVLTSFVYRGDLQRHFGGSERYQDGSQSTLEDKANALVDRILQVFGKQRRLAEDYARLVVRLLEAQVNAASTKRDALWKGWSTAAHHRQRSNTFVLLLAGLLMKPTWRQRFLTPITAPRASSADCLDSSMNSAPAAVLATITLEDIDISPLASATAAASSTSLDPPDETRLEAALGPASDGRTTIASETSSSLYPPWISALVTILLDQLSDALVASTTSHSTYSSTLLSTLSGKHVHRVSSSTPSTPSTPSSPNAVKSLLKRTHSLPHMITFDTRISNYPGQATSHKSSGVVSRIHWRWRETQDFLVQLEEALGKVAAQVTALQSIACSQQEFNASRYRTHPIEYPYDTIRTAH